MSADVDLTVGAVSESVEVTASSAEVQTDSAQVATTIDTKQIQNLTLNGRNPIYLAALTPGVVGGRASERSTRTASATAASTSMADGPTNTWSSSMARWPRARAPPGSMLGALDVDTVQEVQVLTGNYSAEYGRSSAGQIRFVTKSGTRDFHGDLVENFRNSALDANTWTRNHSPQASRPSGGPAPYRFNQYGFDVGGPVFIPKHFNTRPQQAVLLLGRRVDQAALRHHQHRHGPQRGDAERRFQRTAERRATRSSKRSAIINDPANGARRSPATSFPPPASATTVRRC